MNILVNGGFVGRRITGLQRYALEVSQRLILKKDVRLIVPDGIECSSIPEKYLIRKRNPLLAKFINGVWDISLSRDMKNGGLLWSPCNLGPAIHNHVVTIHDLAVFKNPGWFSRGFSMKYRYLLPKVAHSCIRIITDTNTVKDEICTYFNIPEEKVVTAPLGVSERLLTHEDSPVASSLKNLLDSPYFVTLGSIDPRKNLQFLLEEWRIYQETRPGVRLLVVGAESGAFSKQDFSIPPDCEFLGYIDDPGVATIIRKAKALIYPSLYEGFSFPPLEAMALGTPAIISNIPVHAENYGGIATFFDPLEKGSLADILVSGKFPDVDGDAVSALLKSRFNWEVCSNKIYTTLCDCHERLGRSP